MFFKKVTAAILLSCSAFMLPVYAEDVKPVEPALTEAQTSDDTKSKTAQDSRADAHSAVSQTAML